MLRSALALAESFEEVAPVVIGIVAADESSGAISGNALWFRAVGLPRARDRIKALL
ncbi:hypothetical protein [Streptomyces laurentii]|uniref:hypothetical protein n=1 Tax=Streptomyces laurentii TaxID=39478 RepID=UPI0036835B7A